MFVLLRNAGHVPAEVLFQLLWRMLSRQTGRLHGCGQPSGCCAWCWPLHAVPSLPLGVQVGNAAAHGPTIIYGLCGSFQPRRYLRPGISPYCTWLVHPVDNPITECAVTHVGGCLVCYMCVFMLAVFAHRNLRCAFAGEWSCVWAFGHVDGCMCEEAYAC